MATVLTHSDESSGTTILDDGTKLYWTEGYSDTVIVYPDGRREVVGPFQVEDHPLVDEIVDPGADDMRQMTKAEEEENERARDGGD